MPVSKILGHSLVGVALWLGCGIACVYWTLYAPVGQMLLWAWFCEIWAPSMWPLVLSCWYWCVPAVLSLCWALESLRRLIEGVAHPRLLMYLCLLLWLPLWAVPVVSLALGIGSILGFVLLFKQL